jgi:hypothetical protein
MTRFSLPALACACALTLAAGPARADEKAAPAKDDLPSLIQSILENEVRVRDGGNLNDIPLVEVVADLSKRHNLNFVINEESFKAVGRPNIREEKPNLAMLQVSGPRLHQYLRVVLESLGATYLIRNNSIEIVPVQYAAKVTKSTLLAAVAEGTHPQLAEPLVSAILKEKPLSEAIAQIAKTHDLTVLVSPRAAEARKEPVSARLLNVPADKALELLALQADLRVVRRGNAFLITSRDQANEILEEELTKQRQQIELKRLRGAKPAGKPAGLAPRLGIPIPGDVPLGQFQPAPGGAQANSKK